MHLPKKYKLKRSFKVSNGQDTQVIDEYNVYTEVFDHYEITGTVLVTRIGLRKVIQDNGFYRILSLSKERYYEK